MYILALFVNFLLCLTLTFLTVVLSKKVQNPTRDYVPKTEGEKVKISPFGGVVMFLSSLIISIFFIESYKSLLIFLPIFGMLILGFIDDLKKILFKNYSGVSAKFKLFWQNLIAIFIIFAVFRINPEFTKLVILVPFYGELFLNVNLVIAFILAYFAFTGTVNAVNLTDGLDGLAGKQMLVILGFLIVLIFNSDFSYINFNMKDLLVILCTIFGSVIAFLFFNSNPAKIFMGDAGSMALGCLISLVFIMLRLELMILFIGFVIFAETLSVIMQVIYFKITKGKRIFKMSPIHHHFQLSGVKEQKITEVAFLITFIISLFFLSAVL